MRTAIQLALAASSCLSLATGTAAGSSATSEVVAVGSQYRSEPILDGFVSYSIEFAFFPDYAGNLSHPNTFSNNLLNNIGNFTGTKPYIRVGGNTQDFALYDPNLAAATNGTYVPSITSDYPIILFIGKSFFESYETWPNTKYIHGFNFGLNTTQDRQLLLDTVPLVCVALRQGRLAYWEFGNEADLYTTSSLGPKRPADWNDQDYVNEWLNSTEAIRKTMKQTCPSQANDANYKYYAPSFAGTGNNGLDAVTAFRDGLNDDGDVGIISSHNYISGATSPGVTLQGTLMNHTRTVESIAPHLNESNILKQYGLPYILGETNSLYNEGRPGLSNTFGAALWGVDFNLWCAANNISRVHMHQGTSYRYQSWQPVEPRNDNGTTLGTKAPYYGNIAVAAMLANSRGKSVTVSNLPLANDTEAAYAAYHNNVLKRIAVINMVSYNYTGNEDSVASRPYATYNFELPTACHGEVGIRRLMANGSDAITGVTFDGYSYNYELENGVPVLLNNVTRGATTKITDGMVTLTVPYSSAAILDLNC